MGGEFLNTTVENYGTFENEGITLANKFYNNKGGKLITGFSNLTIKDGNTFTTAGGDIKGNYIGNGTIILNNTSTLDGNVKQKNLIINNDATLNTKADIIKLSDNEAIKNNGTLNLSSGTNYNTVEGTGKTFIAGNSVNNEALINQELEILNNAALTSELKNINSKFTNNGTFKVLGDLSGTILGNGTTILQSDIVKAQDRADIKGVVDINNTFNLLDEDFSTISFGRKLKLQTRAQQQQMIEVNIKTP